MTRRAVTTPIPRHQPCALPHHEPQQRVRFQRWDKDTQRIVTVTGTVLDHKGRTLNIRTPDGDVWTSCGHVVAEAAR
jgi:hypothetical protein